MANERNPNAPGRSYVSHISDVPYLADDIRNAPRLDNELQHDELQPDPELAEGPAGSGRIAVFAVAIAVVLGAVFYGLNNSSINQVGTSSTAQNTQQTSPPAAPPGMRDVTPHANTGPGMTTGAAPANSRAPLASPASSTLPNSSNPAPK
jgi:hypothetical protein